MSRDGPLDHESAWFSAQTCSKIGMVRTVKDVGDGRSLRFGTVPQVSVDFGHSPMTISPLGYAALVGDDDEFEAGIVPDLECVEYAGQNVEFLQGSGVVAGIVVDHAIAVEQDGLVDRCMLYFCHIAQAMGVPGATLRLSSSKVTCPSETAPKTRHLL